jgi:hypothetical protein
MYEPEWAEGTLSRRQGADQQERQLIGEKSALAT